MVKPTDHEMIVIALPHEAKWGSTRVGQEAEEGEEKWRQEPLLWFLCEETGKVR